jgi:hypothetical protein
LARLGRTRDERLTHLDGVHEGSGLRDRPRTLLELFQHLWACSENNGSKLAFAGGALRPLKQSDESVGRFPITGGICRNQIGFTEFRSVEMATLEQGKRQFKYPSLTTFEYELFPALLHRTSGVEPTLIVGVSSGSFLNDNPSPTARTCHARTPIRSATQ